MDDIIIYKTKPNSKRIKFFIPYYNVQLREKVKKLNTSFWHPHQKLWSIANTENNKQLLKEVIGNKFIIKELDIPKEIKNIPLNETGLDALNDLEKILTIKRYSSSTIQNYKSMFCVFLYKFMYRDLRQITKEEIENFIYELIKVNHIGEQKQNQIINSVKAYYEHVLGLPRTFYDIKRPKKSIQIPNVLSEEEVFKIINSPVNIKHKAILYTIYSGGLRISEVINLRIEDINSVDGYIFIKASKGKRDRKTVLSMRLLDILRIYYKKHKPEYWLFEGQTGGKYSVASVRKVFRLAVDKAGINPWATVHTLRHSFATHCIQNNINMRHIQNMLGHASPKTTELYTKTIEINNKKIESPLDKILKSTKFTNKNL